MKPITLAALLMLLPVVAVAQQPTPLSPGRTMSSVDIARVPAVLDTARFAQAPVIGAPAESPLIRFDGRTADVQFIDGRWHLMAGGARIKDLGVSENDAREALRLVRELGLTHYGTVGTPRPVLEYWLANGAAPRGLPPVRNITTFDRDSLRAEVSAASWCVRDNDRLLFTFGPAEEQARQALALIKRHDFNQVAYVGEPAPIMMVLLNSPESMAGQYPTAAANTLYGAQYPEPARLPSALTELPPAVGMGGSAAVPPIAGANQMPTSASSIVYATMPAPIPFGSAPTVAAAQPGEGTAINWQQLQLHRAPDGWKLLAGDQVIGSFGLNDTPGRELQYLIQHYRVTEVCRVGPSFTYFLVNGQAPRGLLHGVRSVPFRPEALVVQQLAGGWIICHGNDPLVSCGPRFEDAALALQALQRHQFDHLIRVGQEPSTLCFFVKDR